MYTVSKGPSKIVAKTRRGTPNLDSFFDRSRKPMDSYLEESIQGTAKPVFHTNGRKNSSQRHQQEVISPQHEEIIRYIHETWNHIACSPYSQVQSASASSEPSSALYYVDSPNTILQDFKPFDLESWWGRRLFHNITKTL